MAPDVAGSGLYTAMGIRFMHNRRILLALTGGLLLGHPVGLPVRRLVVPRTLLFGGGLDGRDSKFGWLPPLIKGYKCLRSGEQPPNTVNDTHVYSTNHACGRFTLRVRAARLFPLTLPMPTRRTRQRWRVSRADAVSGWTG